MITGISEFDEPETVAPRPLQDPALRPASSTVPPPADLALQSGGVVTAQDILDADRAQALNPDFKPRIVNCRQCRTHMYQRAHEEYDVQDPLCDRCIEWAVILERKDTYEAANRRSRR